MTFSSGNLEGVGYYITFHVFMIDTSFLLSQNFIMFASLVVDFLFWVILVRHVAVLRGFEQHSLEKQGQVYEFWPALSLWVTKGHIHPVTKVSLTITLFKLSFTVRFPTSFARDYIVYYNYDSLEGL